MLIALALAALIVPDDPDAVVTTAPRGTGAVIVGAEAPTTDAEPSAAQVVTVTPHNLTTQEQIDRWISARATDSEPFAANRGPLADDRQMHGYVSGAIGTDNYNSVAVGVSLPIGETGRVDLQYSQTKNGWPVDAYGRIGDYGYGYGGYGYGYGYGARPIGGFDPVYGVRSRSNRSVSLGFSLEDDARRERRSAWASGFTAQD